MSSRPLVGITIPGTPDDHGLARELAANYAGAFGRLGYATEIFPIHDNRPDVMHRLLRPDVRLVFSHGAWIASPDGPLGGGTRDALARADKPVIALIVDPPFAPWLPGILTNLPRRAGVFHIDPGFSIGIENWVASGVQEAFLPCGLHGAPAPPDADARPIPALYVGRVADPDALHGLVAGQPDIAPLFRALVDTAMPDHATPLIHHARALAAELGVPPEMDNAGFRNALNLADQFIRGARRLALLRQLLRHRVHIVTNRLPRVPWTHPGAVVMPPVPYNQMQEMLRQARMTVICQPHFPGALNERIVYAMQAGCAVITTRNPRLGQLFRDGEDMHLLSPDLSDLGEKLAAGTGAAHAEMVARGQETARARHTPDGNLRYMLARMRARGLLDDDLPVPDGPMTQVPPPPEWRLAPGPA